jgi:hypothetical protein
MPPPNHHEMLVAVVCLRMAGPGTESRIRPSFDREIKDPSHSIKMRFGGHSMFLSLSLTNIKQHNSP